MPQRLPVIDIRCTQEKTGLLSARPVLQGITLLAARL